MKKSKPRTLSQAAICLAAIELINSKGLEALNMRELATYLNVEAASLYYHIKNKSELLDLIQETIITQWSLPTERNNWKKYLYDLAISMRKGLLQYPNIVPIFASRPSIGLQALEKTEITFEVLKSAGFKSADILYGYQSLMLFILGHLQAEIKHVPGEMKDNQLKLTIDLDRQKYPNLATAFSKNQMQHYDKWFKFGVKMIISGLESNL